MAKKIKLPPVGDVWEDAQVLLHEATEAGKDEAKNAQAVAKFLDAIVPLDEIISGPVGEIAEKHDGTIFEQIVLALIKAFRVDPEKRAARQAKRKTKREKRRAKRAARKAARQAAKEE